MWWKSPFQLVIKIIITTMKWPEYDNRHYSSLHPPPQALLRINWRRLVTASLKKNLSLTKILLSNKMKRLCCAMRYKISALSWVLRDLQNLQIIQYPQMQPEVDMEQWKTASSDWIDWTYLYKTRRQKLMQEFHHKLQISAFFLFSNFRKGRLLYIHPVGRSVGWST